jgi:hypothetical protein
MEVYIVLVPGEYEEGGSEVIGVFTNEPAAKECESKFCHAWTVKKKLSDENPYKTAYVIHDRCSVDYLISKPKLFNYEIPYNPYEVEDVTKRYCVQLYTFGMSLFLEVRFASYDKQGMDTFVDLVYDTCYEAKKMHESGESFCKIKQFVEGIIAPAMEKLRIKEL